MSYSYFEYSVFGHSGYLLFDVSAILQASYLPRMLLVRAEKGVPYGTP